MLFIKKSDFHLYTTEYLTDAFISEFFYIEETINFNPITTKDFKRENIALKMYVKGRFAGDDGIQGKIIEVLSCVPKSNKKTVAKQGKNDFTIRIDGKLTPCERKINGGRIDGIKTKYIVYSIDINNSLGTCYIPPKVIKTETFISTLYELKAVKTIRHNGTVDGVGIQVSNRKLWHWLASQIDFDRTKDYNSFDIL